MTTVNDPTVFSNAFAGCMSGIINSSRENSSVPSGFFDNQNEVANLYALEFDSMWALLGPTSPTIFDYTAIESNSASTWYNRNLPDISTLGTVTQESFLSLCILIIESIVSADGIIAAEGIVIPKPSSGGGSGWTTVVDIDFTSLPSQTLGTDGDVTIDGMTFVKQGSFYEFAPTAIVHGQGLIFQPKFGSKYADGFAADSYSVGTLPYLYLNLASLYPNLSADTKIRMYLSIGAETHPAVPATSGSNFSMLAVGTEDLISICFSSVRGTNVNPNSESSDGVACNFITAEYGYQIILEAKCFGMFMPNNYSNKEDESTATNILTAQGFFPSAVTCCQGEELSPGSPFPSPSEFDNMQFIAEMSENSYINTFTGGISVPQAPQMSNCGFIVGAGYNDDATTQYSVTIQRIRLDVLG